MRELPIVRSTGGYNFNSHTITTEVIARALVDDRHYPHLIQFRWGFAGKGYPARFVGKETFYLAHEIWELEGNLPVDQLDYIDRNKLNAQISNLRAATCAQNQANRGLDKDSTSGFKGVNFYKRRGKYQAYIKVNGKMIHLGYFDTALEAAKAYDAAALFHHGPYACTNKSLGLN
jgi:hypothetical protein